MLVFENTATASHSQTATERQGHDRESQTGTDRHTRRRLTDTGLRHPHHVSFVPAISEIDVRIRGLVEDLGIGGPCCDD